MHVEIELPKAFSVGDEREFLIVQHLMTRLNSHLVVEQVATGMHVDGSSTVHWGLVYLDGQMPLDEAVRTALDEAGLNFPHNADIKMRNARTPVRNMVDTR